ncbi:anaerobic ribonucleoside-triphosphate reductase activating protein, partial [Desulfovulcanus sp.]
WPGKVTAVLFFGGCNLRCPTCHNARLAWEPQSLPPLDWGEVLKKIDQDKTWLDGLVITGGEPTILPGLEQVLSRLKEFDLPLKMDTNGLRPDVVKLVLEKDLVQVVAVDVKGPWEKYPQLTGNKVSSQKAQECLEALFDMAKKYPTRFIFRCTKVPDLTEEDIHKARSYLPKGFELREQTYIEPKAN